MFYNFISGLRPALAAAACALPVAVSAATVDLLGSSFGSGTTYTATGLLGGIDATFTASGGNFQTKTSHGWTGVGVSGKTGGEIDIGESISGRFSQAVYVPYLTLAFLFDGPEFGDVQETASISAVLANGSQVSYTLTALFRAQGQYSGPSLVDNLSAPTRHGAGVWEIEDPFDGQAVTGIALTALEGACGRGRCDNQSDFALHGLGIERTSGGGSLLAPLNPGSVVSTPEPETYAMVLAGLALLGAVARRRLTPR
jgi:hypothetical protein